jgi:hypothetical protein
MNARDLIETARRLVAADKALLEMDDCRDISGKEKDSHDHGYKGRHQRQDGASGRREAVRRRSRRGASGVRGIHSRQRRAILDAGHWRRLTPPRSDRPAMRTLHAYQERTSFLLGPDDHVRDCLILASERPVVEWDLPSPGNRGRRSSASRREGPPRMTSSPRTRRSSSSAR